MTAVSLLTDMEENQTQNVLYSEEIVSVLLVGIHILLEILFISWSLRSSIPELPLFFMIITFFSAINLYGIRIVIDKHDIILCYGFGIFQRIIDRSNIESCSIEKNDYISAALFNLKAEQVLVLNIRDGRKVAVPTDFPQKIAKSVMVV